MGLIANYNLRSMVVRKGTAAMTAMGIAMVVAVFVMTLSIAQGFRATLVASGSPDNVIIMRKGSTSENVSSIGKPQLALVDFDHDPIVVTRCDREKGVALFERRTKRLSQVTFYDDAIERGEDMGATELIVNQRELRTRLA